MAKNFQKAERNVKIDGEYKLLSYASSSESVEMTDGTDLQTKMDSVDSDISNEVSRSTAKENEIASNLSSHTSNTSNPHDVTKEQVGLGNVGNFKAVSTVASQGLTDTEKSNARANIGAGTSSFSGSYNDLSNKPTIPTVGNGTVTIKQAGTSKGTFTMNQTGDTTIELTDNNTTYSSKSAASGGTDVSLVTTGEKYTWNNKANASHGNHVPTTQTANNAVFLRNDNTWQTVTPANIGAAASSHTHSAYVNQNAFSNVTVGSTTVSADSATDTLTLVAGSNVTITPDATNDKITIASTDTNTWRGISSTYTSSITNASTTSFSQEGAYNLYTALNSNLKWIYHGSAIGQSTISIPSSAKELYIEVNANDDWVTFFIATRALGETAKKFKNGWCASINPNYYGECIISATNTEVTLVSVKIDGSSKTSSSIIYLNYR